MDLIDPSSHDVSMQGSKVRQRLGKTPLSRYIECGTTQIGPNADSYEVYLSVLTKVEPGTGKTSTISTTVDASARPIAFAQAYSRCSSKGVLEPRIVEIVKAKLQP